MRFVLSMSTGYNTYLEFIEAVGSEMMKVLTIISMTIIEEEYMKLNVQEEGITLIMKVMTRPSMDGWFWLGSMSQIVSIHIQMCM